MRNNTSKKLIKILIVEDDVELCRGWQDLFDFLGYEYRCHRKASSALNDVNWLKVTDIIISDYYLPDLNGVELIKRVREIVPDVPVIVLTGSKEVGVAKAVQSLPSSTLLHKPINIDDLEAKVIELCSAGTKKTKSASQKSGILSS